MPRTDYEGRQDRRRERLEARAVTKHAEAKSRWAESDRLAQAMNGQPVLIGHHSEKRHRRDIERMGNNLHKGCEAHNEAGELERRAASVGSGGISSDDPAAVGKLRAKLESLTGGRDRMKTINAAWRKHGKPRPDNAEAWTRIAQTLGFDVATVQLDMARDFMHRAPYTYAITNIGSEIRRLEQRIKDLARAEAMPGREVIEGDGWRIWEDRDENRLFISHDSKPSAEVCAALKRHGFRWNRYATAWTRLLNESAWGNAKYLAENGLLDVSGDIGRRVDDPPAAARCDDCQEEWPVSALKEPQHLEERMDHPPGHPDRIEPAGKCPGCGALAYAI